jgi:hypothetical protein
MIIHTDTYYHLISIIVLLFIVGGICATFFYLDGIKISGNIIQMLIKSDFIKRIFGIDTLCTSDLSTYDASLHTAHDWMAGLVSTVIGGDYSCHARYIKFHEGLLHISKIVNVTLIGVGIAMMHLKARELYNGIYHIISGL